MGNKGTKYVIQLKSMLRGANKDKGIWYELVAIYINSYYQYIFTRLIKEKVFSIVMNLQNDYLEKICQQIMRHTRDKWLTIIKPKICPAEYPSWEDNHDTMECHSNEFNGILKEISSAETCLWGVQLQTDYYGISTVY